MVLDTSTYSFEERTTVSIIGLIVGCILIPANILLLVCITQPDASIPRSVRQLIVHQASLLIIMAVAFVRTNFVDMTSEHEIYHEPGPDGQLPNFRECMIKRVSHTLTESLVGWCQTMLAIYALALQHGGTLLQALLRSQGLQIATHLFIWVLVFIEALVLFVGLELADCNTALNPQVSRGKGVVDLASDIVSVTALILYCLRSRHCFRSVASEASGQLSSQDLCLQAQLLQDERSRIAGSLVRICLIVTVLHSTMATLSILESVFPDQSLNLANSSVRILWYWSNVSPLLVLVVRHVALRRQLTRVLCHKCLYNHDFQADLHGTVMERCQELASKNNVQANILGDRKKRESVFSISPAIMKTMSSQGHPNKLNRNESVMSRQSVVRQVNMANTANTATTSANPDPVLGSVV